VKGKILDYNLQEGEGIISADNGERYNFTNKNWKSSIHPSSNQTVDFTPDATQAIDIYVIDSKNAYTHTTVIQSQQTSGLAITSMIFGILGFLSSWWLLAIPSIIAIITGHIARSSIKNSQDRMDGDGFALVGLILGYLIILAYVAIVFIFVGVIGAASMY